MIAIRWRLVHLLAVTAASLGLAGAAVADKLDDITTRGVLLVGVTETSPPFSYRDPGKGLVGYDVDLAGAVAERLGVRIETVAILNKQRLSALKEDKVDLVATGMTRSAGRAREIGFSLAYFNSPHKVLIRRDSGLAKITDLAGRTLALVASASVDEDLKSAVPTLKIVFFDHYQAAFDALRDRKVDSFLADELLLLSFAERSGARLDFDLLAGYELPRTAGFGIKKGEARLTGIVDRTLMDLEASGRAARIFETWFAPLPRPFKLAPD